jgi:hypothetical protein
VPQNRWDDEDGMRHTLRSNDLLLLEASWGRVFQSSLKIGGGTTRMMRVASSLRSCGDEAEDGRVDVTGYIRVFYPNLVIFVGLDHNGGLVISFLINRISRIGGVDQAFSHPSTTPSHSCFLRSVDVFHGVREERE